MKVIQMHNLKLAADFFFNFARFEYALKAVGYRIMRRGNIEADWRRLAEELDYLFQNPSTQEFEEAVKYYIKRPPMKECLIEDRLVWREAEPSTDLMADKVLVYVRRVRNNLFHGGKFSGKYLADPERSNTLMEKGLIILDTCLSAIPELREAYEGHF